MPDNKKSKPLPEQAKVKGDWMTWSPVDVSDEPLEQITLPLRLSAGAIADLGNVLNNIAGYIQVLSDIAPDHADVYPNQDSVDLRYMYQTWERCFEERAEATLGE